MRALALAAVLIAVALIQPSGTAHKNHLEVLSGVLPPLANQTYSLGFDDTPMIGGWVFLLEARVQGGDLGAELSLLGRVAKTWTIPPVESWYDTTILPEGEDGFYNLTLTNPGAVDVTYFIYYDQSCNCFAKDFPDPSRGGILIPNEYVIFDVDVAQPSTVAAEFFKPTALAVKITAAVRPGAGARWPGDFTALGVADTATPRQAGPGIPPVWMYDLSVTVSTATRLYYFVQALRVDHPENMTLPTAMTVGINPPTITPTPASLSPVFLYGGLAAVFAVLGTFILLRNRRQRALDAKPVKKNGSRNPKGKGRKGGVNPRRGGARGGSRTRGSPAPRRRS